MSSKNLIPPQTTAKTAAYDSGQDAGCAVLIYAGPLADGEIVQIGVPLTSASGTVYAMLYHNGTQVTLTNTNPVQQLSLGPNYVVIKPVTAGACAVDVCPLGK